MLSNIMLCTDFFFPPILCRSVFYLHPRAVEEQRKHDEDELYCRRRHRKKKHARRQKTTIQADFVIGGKDSNHIYVREM